MPRFSTVKFGRDSGHLSGFYAPEYFHLQGRILCKRTSASDLTRPVGTDSRRLFGDLDRAFHVRFYCTEIEGEPIYGYGADDSVLLGESVRKSLSLPEGSSARMECLLCLHGWGDNRRGHFLPINLPREWKPLSSADSNVIHVPYSLMMKNFRFDEADFNATKTTLFRSDSAMECVNLDALHQWVRRWAGLG
jgi:hypothetical protein